MSVDIFGPVYGSLFLLLVFIYFLSFAVLFNKIGFLNSVVVVMTSVVFSGSGAVLGFIGLNSGWLSVLFAYIFYFVGLILSVKVLKQQGNKLVVGTGTLGEGYEHSFGDPFEEEDS